MLKKLLLLSLILNLNDTFAAASAENSVTEYIIDLTEREIKEISEKNNAQDICSICHAPLYLQDSKEYQLLLSKAACQAMTSNPHIFHKECILAHIKFKLKENQNLSCPICNKQLYKSIFQAISDGNLASVKELLSHRVNFRNNKGDTILMYACTIGNFNIAQLLLEHNLDINAKNDKGYTALMFACCHKHLNIAKLLLDHNADTNVQTNSTKTTAFIQVCNNGDLNIVKLLLEYNVNINAEIYKDVTVLIEAFHQACSGGHSDIVEFLLELGANVNAKNNYGHTPLMVASGSGHSGIVKLLLDHGANINTKVDRVEFTALTEACTHFHFNIAKILLEHGANPTDLKNEFYRSKLLIHAEKNKYEHLVKPIKDEGTYNCVLQ